MSEIIKVYTAEQLYELMKNKIISDNVGLTNFNEGSRIRSILEAVALVESATGFDYLDALRKSIRIALYDGFGFSRKPATYATGYLRFYRMPALTIRYTGGTSCTMTIDGTRLITNCSNPAHNLDINFTTYTTANDIVDYINLFGNYSAHLYNNCDSTMLYHYSNVDIYNSRDVTNNQGFDIMEQPANEVFIPAGTIVTINNINIMTTLGGTIPLGSASGIVLSQCGIAGSTGNISVNAIDTRNGKGVLTTAITGVEYVINDSAFTGGAEEESEDERLKRFQEFIRGLQGATISGITAAVLGIAGIRSCAVRDNYPQRGQITVVADDGTGGLSIEKRAEIIKVLYGDPLDFDTYPGYRAAGIMVNVTAPTVVPINVDITLYRIGTTSNENDILTKVKTNVEDYINTRKLGQDVVLSEIIKRAKTHPAVYDVVVNTPTANVSIDINSIARTGSGTGANVTVTLVTLDVEP